MRSFQFAILFIIFFSLSASSSYAEEWIESQFIERSAEFLQGLDDGRFDSAWQATNPLFKILNDRERWLTRNKALRAAYGSLISRNTRHVAYRKTYTNSPDGDYVIIQHDSVFTNKAKAVETVILDCPALEECSIREYIIN